MWSVDRDEMPHSRDSPGPVRADVHEPVRGRPGF